MANINNIQVGNTTYEVEDTKSRYFEPGSFYPASTAAVCIYAGYVTSGADTIGIEISLPKALNGVTKAKFTGDIIIRGMNGYVHKSSGWTVESEPNITATWEITSPYTIMGGITNSNKWTFASSGTAVSNNTLVNVRLNGYFTFS